MDEPVRENSPSGRPTWQWMLLGGVVALVLGGLLYGTALSRRANKVSVPASPESTATSTSAPSASPEMTEGDIITVRTDTAKGNYLADPQAMTLYVFDKDKPGESSCNGSCAAVWPPYAPAATISGKLPNNVTLVTRTDTAWQFAWKGKPLYYYSKDTQPGDLTGDGVNGVWHLARP